MTPERTLPHNLEAERAVLGAVLIDAAQWDTAAALVGPTHFFRDAHRRIAAAMTRLVAKQLPVELVTLNDELARAGELEEVGGPAYIASLIDGVPRATNVEYYAGIVRERWVYRELIFAANRILARAYEADQPADVLVDEAEHLVMDVGAHQVRSDFVLASDWMVDVMRAIQTAYEQKRVVTGVPTGLVSLDRMTRGWQPTDLIYIAARPSTGKTSLALQMALHAAREHMTGFVSVEMSKKSVGMRAVSMVAHVDHFNLQIGRLSDDELERIGRAGAHLAELRLAIDDGGGQTAASIRGKVRRLAARYGLRAVFIDYMQLLRHADGRPFENRNLELAAISAGLKDLAKELEIPIIVLSQLSRDSARGNRRPELHDMRDSGALEQDADVVLMLHRPGQHDENQRYADGEDAELIVRKQRNGPTGTLPLVWVGSQMRFADRTRRELP
ncbi:MAG: replicative DNA helicase [Vicinamibacterales bacterium]